MGVDDGREHRIGLAKELTSLSVGEGGALPRTSTHAHALSRRSVSTISMTSATVSSLVPPIASTTG